MANINESKRAVAEIKPLTSHIPSVLGQGAKIFWAIVKFESDKKFNCGYLWNLHLTFDKQAVPFQDKYIVNVRFVAGPDAPEYLLFEGSKFLLLGSDLKTVKAEGVIIGLK